MKESNQDRKILDYIKGRYGNACRTEKRHADRYSEGGLPDLNIVVYGVSIQIEDKVQEEFPRDNQFLRLLEYETAGAISFWCDSFEMFLYKWEELVEGDERFQYMKKKWEERVNKVDNWGLAFIDYKEKHMEDRKLWIKYYKENK